jgi:hypothetical protein
LGIKSKEKLTYAFTHRQRCGWVGDAPIAGAYILVAA